MALIKCPECGKSVSDRANTCPNCGFPFDSEEIITAKSDDETKCPFCHSNNVTISIEEVGSETRGKAEVRKKSIVTRTLNSGGRKGMILATGGLWALTPKRSKYKEVKKNKSKTNMMRYGVCQHCGKSWKIGRVK